MNQTQRFERVMQTAERMKRALAVVESGVIYLDDELRAELVNNAAGLKELLPELYKTRRQAIACGHFEGAEQAEEIITAILLTSDRVAQIETAAHGGDTIH
jgi:hypothetical protein